MSLLLFCYASKISHKFFNLLAYRPRRAVSRGSMALHIRMQCSSFPLFAGISRARAKEAMEASHGDEEGLLHLWCLLTRSTHLLV